MEIQAFYNKCLFAGASSKAQKKMPRKGFFKVWLPGLVLFCLIGSKTAWAQYNSDTAASFQAVLEWDTLSAQWPKDTLRFQDQPRLPLRYLDESHTLDFQLSWPSGIKLRKWLLIPTSGLRLLDTAVLQNNQLQVRLKLSELSESDFQRIRWQLVLANGDTLLQELPIQAYAPTRIQVADQSTEYFVGEEKKLRLLCNRPENVRLERLWQEQGELEYRMSREGGELYLHILPRSSGRHELEIDWALRRPFLGNEGWTTSIEDWRHPLEVEAGRLAFLDIRRKEITLHPEQREIELQLAGHRRLQMNHTYRLEAQEKPGGQLVGELYTKSELNNNRVLALFRPYEFHRQSDGYLYIKDGDEPVFLTNFTISPETEIHQVELQRHGEDWQNSQVVHPGEIVQVRLSGQGLHKGHFTFYGAPLLEGDSLIRNEEVAYFTIKIPMDVQQRKLEIFHNEESTGHFLKVEEYQRPRPLDFIDIRLGSRRYGVKSIQRPIYYDQTLADLVVDFKPNRIDRRDAMHGVQYLALEVSIRSSEGNLIEIYRFDDLTICPGETSPRVSYYDAANCRQEDLNLNEFIARKTYNLPEWSSIELKFSHREERYSQETSTKRVKVILQRKLHFDIDVSFPAGLLILKEGENDFSNFSGISFAMIGQFSFYHPQKPGEFRPFKFGAGFIALDAFNFQENTTNRDVGLVAMGSIYPTSSQNKLSFPIFLGYGYLLKQKRGFFLVGPGIRVRL